MNWIQIKAEKSELFKFEIIEKFKEDIFVPKDRWINYQTYSCKIKCPKNINLSGLKGEMFFGDYKINDIYHNISFEFINSRKLSSNRDNDIVKIVTKDIEIHRYKKDIQEKMSLVEKQEERNNKLSELFEL